jgi:uncharacterized phage-associated protein
MTGAPYDSRAVANFLLDLAEQEGLAITNLALQKLLYFAHGHFLIRTGKPLVQGAFEAWTYGPVHPAVYQCFKDEGKRAIKVRAVGRNIMTGEVRQLDTPNDPEVRRHVLDVLRAYGHLSVGRLVDISHAPRGPWAVVANKAKTGVALGLRIPDTVTCEYFRFQKVSVDTEPRVGEPDEDEPLAGYRSG